MKAMRPFIGPRPDNLTVEMIVGYRVDSGLITYLCKWKDLPEDKATYQFFHQLNLEEQELARCYKRDAQIPHFKDCDDDSTNRGHDLACCCTESSLPMVLKLISQATRRYRTHRCGLVAEPFPGRTKIPTGRDLLFVYNYKNHFFVFLLLPSSHRSFVLDGSNIAFSTPAILQELQRLTGRKLKPILFGPEVRVDRCGTPAVAICVALISRYSYMNYGMTRMDVVFPKGFQSLVRKLHPFPMGA